MGRRGPKPTPTAKLKLAGSRRAKARKNEPKPDPAAPACPPWLSDEARDCWNLITPQLIRMGVLQRIDGNAIARYCHLWARWLRLEQSIVEDGETITIITSSGGSYEQQRPEVGIANKLSLTLARLEAEFGMTPSARSRVTVAEEKKTADTNPVTALANEKDDD